MFEIVYLGHDNRIDLLLTSDNEVVDITTTSRATVEFGDTVIDSAVSASSFDWSIGDGVIYLAFGAEDIPVGSYQALLTLYDSVNVNGIVWGEFKCRVV